MKKRVVEHKYTVKRKDEKNGIAVHVNDNNHRVDWEGAKILEEEPRYWRRRTLEAIHVASRRMTFRPRFWIAKSDSISWHNHSLL